MGGSCHTYCIEALGAQHWQAFEPEPPENAKVHYVFPAVEKATSEQEYQEIIDQAVAATNAAPDDLVQVFVPTWQAVQEYRSILASWQKGEDERKCKAAEEESKPAPPPKEPVMPQSSIAPDDDDGDIKIV